LHISELADHKVDSPEDVVKVGDEIEVKILRVDVGERKIGLSRLRLGEEDEEAPAAPQRGRQRQLRGGTGSGGSSLIKLPPSAEPGGETPGGPETE
jgi:small subunit ribosomal protein S1